MDSIDPLSGKPILKENPIDPIVGEKLRDVERSAAKTRRLGFTFNVAVACMAFLAVGWAAANSYQNRRTNNRILDCTEAGGKCYQRGQAQTAAAVQAILDHIDGTMAPHRLRNEAENLCTVVALVEITLNIQGHIPIDVDTALAHYRHCVLENAGNTPAPPLPQNPLTTTTTTGGHS